MTRIDACFYLNGRYNISLAVRHWLGDDICGLKKNCSKHRTKKHFPIKRITYRVNILSTKCRYGQIEPRV